MKVIGYIRYEDQKYLYKGGSKSFRPDIQKPHEMENVRYI